MCERPIAASFSVGPRVGVHCPALSWEPQILCLRGFRSHPNDHAHRLREPGHASWSPGTCAPSSLEQSLRRALTQHPRRVGGSKCLQIERRRIKACSLGDGLTETRHILLAIAGRQGELENTSTRLRVAIENIRQADRYGHLSLFPALREKAEIWLSLKRKLKAGVILPGEPIPTMRRRDRVQKQLNTRSVGR